MTAFGLLCCRLFGPALEAFQHSLAQFQRYVTLSAATRRLETQPSKPKAQAALDLIADIMASNHHLTGMLRSPAC